MPAPVPPGNRADHRRARAFDPSAYQSHFWYVLVWLAGEIEALGDAELAFRLGVLLLDRPGHSMSSGAGWSRQLKLLLPHLEAHLVRNNSSTRKYFAAMNSHGDTFLSARIAQATKMAGG